MGWFTKSWLVIRRLSVFYLFFGVLALVLLFFFIRIIPKNTTEINGRAQRALNQLASNFLQKDKEVTALFRLPSDTANTGSWSNSIVKREMNFDNLDHLHYTAGMIPLPAFMQKITTADSSFLLNSAGNCDWVYYGVITKKSSGDSMLEVRIHLNDFAAPLLDSRGDIFANYLLLLDSPAVGSRRNLPLLYARDPITASGMLSSDTLTSLQKNSDGSADADISISGNSYKIFYRPFFMHGQRLLLAGLLDRDDYQRRTRQTPVDYIPASIIAILILLIALPFIKIFMLGRKESITYKDMALTAFSFYLGPVCGCLIVFYATLHIVNGLTFSHRLHVLGKELQHSVENNISAAGARLRSYDSLDLSKQTGCLLHPVDDSPCMSQLDSMMAEKIDRHSIRVFWIDSAGQTIAKWNPFDFVAPNTSVSGYTFFHRFLDRRPPPGEAPNDSFNVVYPGKSNTTGEFLVFIVRPSVKTFVINQKDPKQQPIIINSIAAAEAMDLDISQHPVLPPGFGFSLVDRDGQVLVDSDPSRNLSENIVEESGENGALRQALQGLDPGTDLDISLYGQSFLAQARPIYGQPLTLVVFYDQKFLSENIIRLLLFAIQTLVWLTLVLCACMLVSTFKKMEPMHLLFRLKTIEWIRPIVSNEKSYTFSFRYFGGLIIAFICIYLTMVMTNQDLRPLYYISLIMPFFGIWGFVVSRTKNYEEQPKTTQALKDVFRLGRYPAYFAGGMNLLLAFIFNQTAWTTWSILWVAGFEIFSLGLLCWLSSYHTKYPFSKLQWVTRNQNSYQVSLIFSMFLMSVLPTAGVLTYGYQAEKLQYKKEKLLGYASALESWEEFLRHDLVIGYKEVVRNTLGQRALDHDLFLTDKDLLDTLPLQVNNNENFVLPDDLYFGLVNRTAIAGGADKAFLAIANNASDKSWKFKLEKQDVAGIPNLFLEFKPLQPGTAIPVIQASTKFRNIIVDFIQLPVIFSALLLFMLFLFVLGATALVKATVRRLFLRHFTNRELIIVDENFLLEKFKSGTVLAPFLKDCIIPKPLDISFFDKEFDFAANLPNAAFSQEDYILAISGALKNVYELIWSQLSPAEKYVLYDFCIDYYTNYKNVEVLISLIQKGVLVERQKTWEIFSLSFRQYVLSKKETPEIGTLLATFRTAGNWEAFRVAALSLIAIGGVVIVATQSELSHQLLALLTSLTALFPLVLKIFQGGPKAETAAPGAT
jgi:hypothetical protein